MEIVPGIHQVDGVNGNCYILERDGLILIDTGLPNSSRRIVSYIRDKMHRDPAAIRTIIVTHYHVDHTGNIAALQAISRAQVAIHTDDAPYLAGTKTAPAPRGMTGLFIRFFGLFMRAGPVKPDILFNDGDTIEGLRVIHVPGHTPGSIALLDQKTGVLFVGDTLRFDGKTIEGPPPQFTPDMEMAQKSIKNIAALEFTILLSGHGVPLKGGAAEKVRDYVPAKGS